MLRFHELRQNPVSVTFRDDTGATITVVAERLRQGLVKMMCDCQRQSNAGWCQHCLAVFSDRQIFEDKEHREAFDRIVGGTLLEETATKLTIALDAFATAYRRLKFGRPSALNPGQLRQFANHAYHASTAAEHLGLALEDFIYELRLRPSRVVRAKTDAHADIPVAEIPEQGDVSEGHPHSVARTPEQSKPATPENLSKQAIAPDQTSAPPSKANDSALEIVRRSFEKDLLE